MVAAVSLMLLFLIPALATAAKPAWQKAPVVPSFTKQDRAKLKVRVNRGRKLGLRSRVFAKVGDSNTEATQNLYGLACRNPRGLSPVLRRTVRRWNQVRLRNARAFPGCRPWTSFSRRSSAAQSGTYSFWALTRIAELPPSGYTRPPEFCSPETTPLACEIDLIRPRYALVMLGTNDIGMDLYFGIRPGSEIGDRVGGVVRALLARGVVPVLSTIPPAFQADPAQQPDFDRGVARSNAEVWRTSKKFGLPMINLWRALNGPGMINRGMSNDGLHFSLKGGGGVAAGLTPGRTTYADSVDFRPAALRFGANRRNLIWLKTLNRLDRITG